LQGAGQSPHDLTSEETFGPSVLPVPACAEPSTQPSPAPFPPSRLPVPPCPEPFDDFDPLEVITRIPAEDPAVYDMICRADTVGVFQIESRAQMAMLPRLRPRRFYDLVIEVAIVRPGPIQGGMVHPYLRRRNCEEPVTFPHPDLVPILERTMGVPLFQEQVMQISITGAGYSGGEADQLRRDMAAWKKTGRLMRHRDRLLSGFAKKGISREFGEALFEQIKGFGDYGFPESHASSFALLVYSSSWEKAHYPAHFACAIINSQPMGFYQPSTLVRDAQRHGVEVRDVCVLRSDWDCTLEAPGEECAIKSTEPGAQRSLRLGLRLVKGLGEAAARRIEEARRALLPDKFTSLEQLTRLGELKKDEVEALAEAGALEALVPGRRQALWKARAPRTPGLFQVFDAAEPEVRLPELHAAEQLMLDYGRKGLSVSDHPMNHLRKRLAKQGVVRAADLLYLKKGAPVRVAGLVLSRQQPATASGVVFITLEDETGVANLIVYSSVYEQFHHVAHHSSLLLATGELERTGDVPRASGSAEAASSNDGARVPVIHVIVRHLERLDRGGSLRKQARNFH
jgi:error-prone DNA polymerase